MIPRKEAKRLLDEFVELVEAGPDYIDHLDLPARRDALLERSDLVLRGAENVQQKARRYLTEGRIRVWRADRGGDGSLGFVVARATSDDGVEYHLGHDPRGGGSWRCTCPAKGSRCAHLAALRLVVTPDDRPAKLRAAA